MGSRVCAVQHSCWLEPHGVDPCSIDSTSPTLLHNHVRTRNISGFFAPCRLVAESTAGSFFPALRARRSGGIHRREHHFLSSPFFSFFPPPNRPMSFPIASALSS